MIRPITDFLTFDKSSAQPSSAPLASIGVNVKSKVPAGEAVPKNLARPPKSTSLKQIVKASEEPVHPVQYQAVKLSAPFSEQDLIQCWDDYAEIIEEKAHLKNTMINCKPVLLDNFMFEVRVHNPAQKEELLGSSPDLLKALRTQLKNDLIQIQILVDDNITKKTVYTNAEKYQFLNDINPLLTNLIQEFDLTME